MKGLKLETNDNQGPPRPIQEVGQWGKKRWLQLKALEGKMSTGELADRVFELMEQLAVLATEEEGVAFSTLFSRLAYLRSLYGLSGRLIYGAQLLRRQMEEAGERSEEELGLGFWVVSRMLEEIWKEEMPAIAYPEGVDEGRRKVEAFLPIVRGMLMGPGEEAGTLVFLPEEENEEVIVQFGVADRNAIFDDNIRSLQMQNEWPVPVNLWQVEVDDQGCYFPRAFVMLPDYLVDVTAIAACFSDRRYPLEDPRRLLPYFLRKLLPKPSTPALLKGNIANHFLDQMLNRTERDFLELFKETFRMYPLEFAALAESEMRALYEDCKQYFVSIRSVVEEDFQEVDIRPEESSVEPSFYNPDLGIQGRLDVLQDGGSEQPLRIVELKSGRAFKPNKYGLSASHYVQTLLYDLLVEYALPRRQPPLSYILYCKETERPLRNAPVVRQIQIEALAIRNRIVLWEQMLMRMSGREKDVRFFDSLRSGGRYDVAGFLGRDLHAFQAVFRRLSLLEKKYYAAFAGFMAREHYIAKVGMHHADRNRGLAAVWRESADKKKDRFSLLNDLELLAVERSDHHYLRLRRSEVTDDMANFRQGDIGILYPAVQRHQPTRGEIVKCSLVELGDREIVLRLRNEQPSAEKFAVGSRWNLEHDVLDSSFIKSFRNLFWWAAAPKRKRAIFLGQQAPDRGDDLEWSWQPSLELSEEQGRILRKMLNGGDYFLLWGPPGTGKTSVMLREYVNALVQGTGERVMLLAYTNRAVDEICQQLEELRGGDERFEYIRVGSRQSVGAAFRKRLLQLRVREVDNREELRAMLDGCRIYVGTVASVSGKRSLLELVKFDRLVIDEASQLLEPMVGGLIGEFPRVLMIGDHRQLPAVVQQHPGKAAVEVGELRELGLDSLANSLFERLYRLAEENQWEHAYDHLSIQGRMHREIMSYPSEASYGGKLQPLDERLSGRDLNAMFQIPGDAGAHLKHWLERRLHFVTAEIGPSEMLMKSNADEAQLVVKLIRKYREIWQGLGREWGPETLGVITPFRSQIAVIMQAIWQSDLDRVETITVDTVERYQGGARDIILMSLCVNDPTRWAAVVSQNTEGIDRKFNVALTRAREYFVLVGNEEMIQKEPGYRSFVDRCKRHQGVD